jgi:hypothetical protein
MGAAQEVLVQEAEVTERNALSLDRDSVVRGNPILKGGDSQPSPLGCAASGPP